MDIATILKELQAQTPPMECPFCGKVYRSFSGASYHVVKFHSNGPTVGTTISTPNTKESSKKPLTYAESRRMVEFDLKGYIFRNLISDSLTIEIEKTETEEDNSNIQDPMPKKSPAKNPPRKRGKGLKTRFNQPKSRTNNINKMKQNFEDKKAALPVASYSILPEEEYSPNEVPERATYYRYIDKPPDELEEEIEYGMDEEDYIWLESINDNRGKDGLQPVPHNVFEMLMDRLEKESHFETRTVTGDPYNLIDEDAVCSICCDGECSNSNVILFCDMCNLAVHQECYGVPYIPEGQWLCRKCFRSPSKPVSCMLCPTKSGAFKQTDTNNWAHVVCALWIPEVCFANTVFLEPIDSIQNIPVARWKLVCYICKKKEGACIQCFKTNCYTAFHVTCAQQGGLHMKIEPGRTENGQPTVKKSAYCDVHMPKDSTPYASDCCSEGEDSDAGSIYSKSSAASKGKQQSVNPSVKLKEVQKKLLEKQSFKLPAVHIPFVPAHRLGKIVSNVVVAKKSVFIQQLQAYWMLKRQSRNGVPLLRRLQANTGSGVNKNQRDDQSLEGWSQSKELKEQLRYWQQLRHDLERARLLIELIRKREKLKKEQYRMKQQMVDLQLKPLQIEMERTFELLQERDTNEIFANPVDIEQAPDYHDFIKNPMDFLTMRQKLSDYEYMNFQTLEDDFNLIVQNCTDFNKDDTVYYKAALKLRKECKPILKAARKRIKQAGIDQQTGMHMECPPAPVLAPTSPDLTSPLADDITALVANPFLTIDEKIEDLEEKFDLSKTIQSALSRLSRQKQLRKEIARFKRQKRSLAEGNADETNEKAGTTDLHRKRRSRKHRKIPQDEMQYNGEVKIAGENKPQDLTLILTENNSNEVQTTVESNGCADRLLQKIMPIVRNPSTGRNRRSGILFKKKEYQPIKPSPLVLYSTTPNDEDRTSPLKIRLRVDKESTAIAAHNEQIENCDPNLSGEPMRSHEDVFTNNKEEEPGDEAMEVEEETVLPSPRKRTYSSSANSDNESKRKSAFHHGKRGRKSTVTLKNEFPDLDGIDKIECGVYMIHSDETDMRDPKCDPESLEMLSLIWAKCKGYPSYPALTIDPQITKGYQYNGVPISSPPNEVLQMNETVDNYLILFFDARRTWQWLPREKIEPLGVDSRLDEFKLVESKKPSMRKNVLEAYRRAILFRQRITSGESSPSSFTLTDDDDITPDEPEEMEVVLKTRSNYLSESLTNGNHAVAAT